MAAGEKNKRGKEKGENGIKNEVKCLFLDNNNNIKAEPMGQK